jgi:hypothetical protein
MNALTKLREPQVEGLQIFVRKPEDMEPFERREIFFMVVAGGCVGSSCIMENLVHAELISYAVCDGKKVATLSVKRPIPEYRDKILSSVLPRDTERYELELGYAFTRHPYRNKNIFNALAQRLFLFAGARPMYATTRHESVVEFLTHLGFRFAGVTATGLKILLYK